MLHPGAMAEIPELEFEIGADHKRRVDSIYNHIGGAIFNLERHVEMLGEDGEQASRERQGIMDVCDELRKVLDMEGGPYTLVVTDPGGLSAFKPPTGVKVTALEQTTQYDRAARALAVAEEDEDGGDESDDSDDESAELLAAALADMKTGDECDVTRRPAPMEVPLPLGSAVLYDARVCHLGGANRVVAGVRPVLYLLMRRRQLGDDGAGRPLTSGYEPLELLLRYGQGGLETVRRYRASFRSLRAAAMGRNWTAPEEPEAAVWVGAGETSKCPAVHPMEAQVVLSPYRLRLEMECRVETC